MSSWDKVYAGGEQLNRYPYAEVVSFVKRQSKHRPTKILTALDVGCGSGVHAAFMAAEGAHVMAFDASAKAVEHAKTVHASPNIDYRVFSLADFDAGARKFGLVVDRLSSTYASADAVRAFYQGLKSSLNPGARLLWQGFDPDNSGRAFGYHDTETDLWTGFSAGVFRNDDTITFFSEDDLKRIFDGYEIASKRIISDTNLESGYRHSYWNLELTYPTGAI